MDRLDRAHFMAAVAFNTVFMVNMRLSIFDSDGFSRTALSAFAAADTDAFLHLGPRGEKMVDRRLNHRAQRSRYKSHKVDAF